MKRPVLLTTLLGSILILAACSGEVVVTPTPAPTPTPTPTLTPAPTDRGPEGYVLSDPSFQALEGAQAFFGELDGTLYNIEIPDNWNGRLVLWAHGFQDFHPELRVFHPPFRRYLIEKGYAWAASSFSSNSFVAFEGTHETAALHDLFIQKFGQPKYAYISGQSMGGRVTLLSLELFPRRYDGALSFCSVVDLGLGGHYLVLGAYAAGVTQEEFDRAQSVANLIYERILPALLADPQARALFERLVTSVTGGPMPFRHEGLDYDPQFNFIANASLVIGRGVFANTDFVYPGDPASGVYAEEVNAQVVRIRDDADVRNVDPNFSDLAGAVPVPLLMLHTTGDGLVPFSGMQLFRGLADAASNGDLLVQRAIRAPGHCDFSEQELTRALEDLVNWVENGIKAKGEDVLGPAQDLGLQFTDPAREGDPALTR